jgi:osmotically-inducible protein OsmY
MANDQGRRDEYRARNEDDFRSGQQAGGRNDRWQQDQTDYSRRHGYGEQGGRQQRGESFSRDFSGSQQSGGWESGGTGQSGFGQGDHEGGGRGAGYRGGSDYGQAGQRSFNQSNAYGGRDEWTNRGGYSGQDQGYRGYEDSGSWTSGRSYGGGDRGRSEGGRDFWDKAGDEVSSWFGDKDAERRRRMDEHRGRGPKSYARSDDRIKEDINDRLTDDGWLDATDIDVEVSSREVTLSGEVDSRDAKRRAEDIAESVSGVGHVQNNLRVRQRDQSGYSSAGSSTSGTGSAITGGGASTSGVGTSTTSRNRI